MLLQIKNLKINYKSCNRMVEVVRGVDLDVKRGQCVGLVGESGCGKTTIGLSITKLISSQKADIASGEIIFEGRDILKLNQEELRNVRGKKISYVFQEPFSSLNPVFTIYEQIEEVLPGADSDKRIAEIFKSVGLDSIGNYIIRDPSAYPSRLSLKKPNLSGQCRPQDQEKSAQSFCRRQIFLEKIIGRKNVYPHELSGGMQQRAMIGMAIASKPDLLILDEPTTALDVTIQRQILDLIVELKNKINLSMLFISHDLRTVFKIADRVSVMYAGCIVEEGKKEDIVAKPAHPYTMGLLDSIPSFEHRKKAFNAISGKAPLFTDLPDGCKFYPRCKFRIDRCMEKEPDLENITDTHISRCIRIKELAHDGIIKNK